MRVTIFSGMMFIFVSWLSLEVTCISSRQWSFIEQLRYNVRDFIDTNLANTNTLHEHDLKNEWLKLDDTVPKDEETAGQDKEKAEQDETKEKNPLEEQIQTTLLKLAIECVCKCADEAASDAMFKCVKQCFEWINPAQSQFMSALVSE
ncbi:unnamed protein product [Rotaria sp. Silwood1]|nr:unnamed protein product [Rotaria sp. Silwood1]